jgi:hypothetical protein
VSVLNVSVLNVSVCVGCVCVCVFVCVCVCVCVCYNDILSHSRSEYAREENGYLGHCVSQSRSSS